MPALLEPSTAIEVCEAIRASARVISVGAETKPRLSAVTGERISTLGLSGIVEYDPSEFTFTGLAGTPLKLITQTLGERGQYLPFDPMLVDSGATLGGAIASNLSGPGRFRFGGVRDFILGVQFVDGMGRLLRMGGKVVKNAAGFDVPKFLTGSLGRFGFITEATFKVFPRPASYLTLGIEAGDMSSAVQIMTAAARARWELDALDVLPGETTLAMRIGGPKSAIAELAREILSQYPGKRLEEDSARTLWTDLRELRWADSSAAVVKVPLTPEAVVHFIRALEKLEGARAHISAGGNVAFVALPLSGGSRGEEAQIGSDVPKQDKLEPPHVGCYEGVEGLDCLLREQNLQGMMIRGPGPLWLGRKTNWENSRAVKQAFDPEDRYPALDD